MGTFQIIALIANLTQSLGGVKFKIDTTNDKPQVSIDGGATWENFSGGDFQHGEVSVTITANATTPISVTFPEAFSATPTVVVGIKDLNVQIAVQYVNASTTGFTCSFNSRYGTTRAFTVSWVAYIPN